MLRCIDDRCIDDLCIDDPCLIAVFLAFRFCAVSIGLIRCIISSIVIIIEILVKINAVVVDLDLEFFLFLRCRSGFRFGLRFFRFTGLFCGFRLRGIRCLGQRRNRFFNL